MRSDKEQVVEMKGGENKGGEPDNKKGDVCSRGGQVELGNLWHIAHKYTPLSVDSLGIDPPISNGFTGSLVPITSNRSHRHQDTPLLTSRSPDMHHPHPRSITRSLHS